MFDSPWLYAVAAVLLLMRLSGTIGLGSIDPWRRLARRYRAPPPPRRAGRWDGVGRMDGMRCGIFLAVLADEEGIALWIDPPFNLSRAPLMLPWRAISNRRRRRDTVTFTCGGVEIALSGVAGDVMSDGWDNWKSPRRRILPYRRPRKVSKRRR